MRRTKIVCTIGPKSESPALLRQLIRAGMEVARLNFSHGTQDDHRRRIMLIRKASEELARPVAILQDLCGPRLRVGEITEPPALLRVGATFTLTRRAIKGDGERAQLAFPSLLQLVKRSDRMMLDDGLIELRVTRVTRDEIVTRVVHGGPLGSHKGINLPDRELPIAAVTRKDLDDLRFGLAQGVDWVAMSFVRNAGDLEPLRQLMARVKRTAPIIAKIEKHEAIRNLDQIIAAADGIMVARGDLGVEMALDEVPLLQKEIISRCSLARKPVITATQMLESMIEHQRPTRAEVSDVANAILDGTDAIMLSGETAIGKYPVAAVRAMARIAQRTEEALDFEAFSHEHADLQACDPTDAIAQATCMLAADLPVKAIITPTASGQTPRLISKHRPGVPIIAAACDQRVRSRLPLLWGVHPVAVPKSRNSDQMIEHSLRAAQRAGLVKPGDLVVVTGGWPAGVPGKTNAIRLTRIP